MNEPTIDKTPAETPSVTGRIDILCDQFESAWKAGQPPRIEDLLANAPHGLSDVDGWVADGRPTR